MDDLPALDDVDRRILAELVADGRMSVNGLAERVGVSRATAYSRLERLQGTGVITGFRAEVDPVKAGLPVAALILANVEQHAWQEARDELLRLPGVEYLAFTSGGFDMVLLVRVPDVVSLRDVVLVQLHGSRHVRSTQTIFVLDESRRPGWPGSGVAGAAGAGSAGAGSAGPRRPGAGRADAPAGRAGATRPRRGSRAR
jgi:DNA-binding Lrp family transcriptional regulator